MRHRGPDDFGEWWSEDGRVGLAHRRLAILDLSPAGRQPMQNAAKELTIVFNGEIYNFADLRSELKGLGHRFRSHSDTEVVLAAYRQWGTKCLSRLNGMFALALHDTRNQRLFLARDRAGEKPLFLYSKPRELRFASELKGLLADPKLKRRIDPKALDCYLAMGYVPGSLCILQGFTKLPPAHAMTFCLQSGETRMWRYWYLPPAPKVTPGSRAVTSRKYETLVDELELLLQDSVRRQLAADVPVGVLLSGGVDSSLVTAMAVRTTPKVKTFTVGFPGQGTLDETKHARLLARHFGTDHIELTAEAASVELMPLLAHQFDEPIIDSSMLPTFLVSRLVREHCTVALGGDGGDELFGGYHSHQRFALLTKFFGWIPEKLRAIPARMARTLLPAGAKGRNFLTNLAYNYRTEIPFFSEFYDRSLRQSLLPGLKDMGDFAEDIRRNQRTPRESDALQRITRMDFQNYLPEDILVKVDRASMLNSLEIRAPMLDHRLIEFAFGRVPSYLKATPHHKKILLKNLTARILPPKFDRQRKQGFSIPLANWLKAGPFREFFYDVLLDPGCLFDQCFTNSLLKSQEQGRNNSERLFALVLFELWRREYALSL